MTMSDHHSNSDVSDKIAIVQQTTCESLSYSSQKYWYHQHRLKPLSWQSVSAIDRYGFSFQERMLKKKRGNERPLSVWLTPGRRLLGPRSNWYESTSKFDWPCCLWLLLLVSVDCWSRCPEIQSNTSTMNIGSAPLRWWCQSTHKITHRILFKRLWNTKLRQ